MSEPDPLNVKIPVPSASFDFTLIAVVVAATASFTASAKRVAPHGYTLTNKTKGFTLYMSAVNTSGSQSFTGHLTYHAGKGNYVTEAVSCTE